MKIQPKPLTLIVSSILGSVLAMPAQSALITNSTTASFNNSNSVTDSEGGSSTSNNNASLGTSFISQFDSNVGVLTGTTLHLNSTRTQTVTVTATGSGTSSTTKTTSGSGSSTASLSAAGASGSFGNITASGSCSGSKQAGCSSTTSSAPTTTNAALGVSTGNLDSYVGSATVLVTRTAPTLTATQTNNSFPGAESTTSKITWAGDIYASYEYLLHAAPSFDENSGLLTLDLDFGEHFLGDAVDPLSFNIFNLFADYRIGLDLDSFTGIGDTTWLTTDLGSNLFQGLGAGSNAGYFAFFDASNLGDFSASYFLNLSDADVGAESSRFNYRMQLNLTGKVIEKASPLVSSVPEPGLLALFGASLAGLGWNRRRNA